MSLHPLEEDATTANGTFHCHPLESGGWKENLMTTIAGSAAAAAGTFALGGDLTVNRLGYGTMQLTGPGVWGDPKDPAEAVRVLRRAVELGVTFIDTADSYGPFVAQQLVKKALHPYADGLVSATKLRAKRQGPNLAAP